MRLLVSTQAVDERDPTLGFFVRWIGEIARHVGHVVVICLKEGAHTLPANVRVLSLGKSAQGRPASGWGRGVSRLKYMSRLFRYVWRERGNYDVVFVHQNQEYVLLLGWLWKCVGKRIFMWRNHYAGSFMTDIAALFCDKIFCTSAHSYTAKYRKTTLMPVGVDTDMFRPALFRTPRSILFLGRVAPSKRPDLLIKALDTLASRGSSFTASLYGPTLPTDYAYRDSLRRRINELNLENRVLFHEGVPHTATPALYASHEIFVNLSGSGMYDKTLFEAAASGCLIVSSSKDFGEIFDPRFTFDGSAESLATCLAHALDLSADERKEACARLRMIAETNSLQILGKRLAQEMDL